MSRAGTETGTNLATLSVIIGLHLGHGTLQRRLDVVYKDGDTLSLGQIDEIRTSTIVVLNGRHRQLQIDDRINMEYITYIYSIFADSPSRH